MSVAEDIAESVTAHAQGALFSQKLVARILYEELSLDLAYVELASFLGTVGFGSIQGRSAIRELLKRVR